MFRPFGEVHAITGTESVALRFPGQLLDPETGFHQNWFRDYDPRLGRYMQSDPIGLAGGLNTYAYAIGDPINAIDHDGQNPVGSCSGCCQFLSKLGKILILMALLPAARGFARSGSKKLPVARLDYGPFRATHGQPRLHGHLPRLLPDKHIPLDPRSLFD